MDFMLNNQATELRIIKLKQYPVLVPFRSGSGK